MVEEGVDVKFRWFRTVETVCESVTLENSEGQLCRKVSKSYMKLPYQTLTSQTRSLLSIHLSNLRNWQPIELVWDKHKLMYESNPYYLPCGKYETNLIIDGKKYPCQKLSVVGTTFEVNLFLQEENVDEQRILIGAKSLRPSAFSPLQVDILWSPTSYSLADDLKEGAFAAREDASNCALTHLHPIDIYAELVASKDREIERLRLEIKQLKMCLVEMDAKASLSTAHSQVEASQTKEMSEELTELQKEKKSLEQETESMVSRIKENEMARESLEWEVQQLRERLSNNDPSEVMQLLVEMKSLREELRIACQKNRELVDEVLKLRDENTRLMKEALVRVVPQDAKLNDSIYFSDDPESGSTQYKELPITLELSKSLPVLGAPIRVQVPQRSVSLGQAQFSSPDSNGSVLTDELLSCGTPNKGVQTDITALQGSPSRYHHEHSSRPSLHHESSASKYYTKKHYKAQSPPEKKPTYFESKVIQMQSFPEVKSFKEEGDSSDTDELLQEADQFVMKTLGESMGILNRINITGKGTMNGINGATSSYIIGGSYTNPSAVHNYSSSSVFGKVKAAKKESLNPFIPKCALDLHVGHLVRYHGHHGCVTQGKVGFVGPIPDRIGTFVGVEDEKLMQYQSSDNPRRTFIPFKKVILAWEAC